MRAPYDVLISQADDGGFVVRVGCKTLVYERSSILRLLGEVEAYFNDPNKVIADRSKEYGWPAVAAERSAMAESGGMGEVSVGSLGAPVDMYSPSSDKGLGPRRVL